MVGAYMYTPIIGTLGYIFDQGRILMVHRNKRVGDTHFGKYNGLGGKMEPTEDVVSCIRREILEEAGVTIEAMTLRGTVNWTGFGPQGQDWLGFIFLITRISGSTFTENAEGTLEWIPLAQIPSLPMWEGDRHFLPLLFDSDPRAFHGLMPYKNGQPQSWSYTRL